MLCQKCVLLIDKYGNVCNTSLLDIKISLNDFNADKMLIAVCNNDLALIINLGII